MLSLQFATAVPASRLMPPPPPPPFKASGTAGRRTGEAHRVSPIPKWSLAATTNWGAYGGSHVEEKRGHDEIQLRPELMPRHVAIMMDRYGGLPVEQGHRASSDNFTRVASECCELGIKALTVSTFSDDDWKRSKVEIDFLMKGNEDYIRSDVKELITRYNIRYSVIGERSKLPESLQESIRWAEEKSRGNKGMHVTAAMSYGGRNDIVEAAKRVAKKVEDGIVGVEEVDESVFEAELMMSKIVAEFPNPDLLIYKSMNNGEVGMIGNFLLWQLAYTEFYFTHKSFPHFGRPDLIQALDSYQRRHRRYGHRIPA